MSHPGHVRLVASSCPEVLGEVSSDCDVSHWKDELVREPRKRPRRVNNVEEKGRRRHRQSCRSKARKQWSKDGSMAVSMEGIVVDVLKVSTPNTKEYHELEMDITEALHLPRSRTRRMLLIVDEALAAKLAESCSSQSSECTEEQDRGNLSHSRDDQVVDR